MERRAVLKAAAALGLVGAWGPLTGCTRDSAPEAKSALSVDDLPELQGDLTVYLGRGEGGLYHHIVDAIRERNPKLNLSVRRAGSASLANTLVQEAEAGEPRADLFWSIDMSSLGMVAERGLASDIPEELQQLVKANFRYPQLAPISGRVRTLAYNTERLSPADIPDDIMALADSDLTVGWAPAYGAFQSFVTAMRLLEGEAATKEWLRALKPRATEYAGELGAVMGAERGEVDISFANHYYTLRLKEGKPDANVAITFTRGDAGVLMNTSGVAVLHPSQTAHDFVRYLLSKEVQEYLAKEAYEIPLVPDVQTPAALPSLDQLQPPELDLTRLADIQPTLSLMREVGLL
ncbi:MAG TPA: extracellular solute-binding protein [Gammaproteobacteria bacterium]|nr:extracellular solute-binding protein [Gammaproteobacteria bacterium]